MTSRAILLVLSCTACNGSDRVDVPAVEESGSAGHSTGHGDSSGGGTLATSSGAASSSGGIGAIFDLGRPPDFTAGETAPTDACKVVDDMDALGDCTVEAPPDSFEPEVQWEWEGENGDVFSIATPLVANLTDDNADGEIDLCDVPDVVIVAWPELGAPSHIYILDGETGASHLRVEMAVEGTSCPALGDIDGDGVPEIVAVGHDLHVKAFDHDGALLWVSESMWFGAPYSALALADIDNDGDVEILAGDRVLDHLGQDVVVLGQSQAPLYSATTAADLDADGDLEIVLGNAAFHHDGSVAWEAPVLAGFPQVANLDDDAEPEILLNNEMGLTLLEHDGQIAYQDLRPTGDAAGSLAWYRPSTIHDFDGDGKAEYAVSSANNYAVYEGDATLLWSAPILDFSGIASGTAFDFLGDGEAEAIYADETNMFVFDATGLVVMETSRVSRTGTEYPVVADIDNDGSAEIVVVSTDAIDGSGFAPSPTVQVIRDVDDRWIQARRIWNQHTYHVTNVREDGVIPEVEPHHWELLNTFRTNAQIEGGGVCVPKPAG